MATTPEGKVKDRVKRFLKKHNIAYRMIVPSPYGRGTGVSDVLAWLPPHGTVLAIECKREGDTKGPTENQKQFLDEINSCGGLGVVVKCEQDILDLQANLKERGLI